MLLALFIKLTIKN